MKFTYAKHRFLGSAAGKAYCIKCGLVALNNEFSRWCIRKGCNHEDNEGFKAWLPHYKPPAKLSKALSDWLDAEIEKADRRNGFIK